MLIAPIVVGGDTVRNNQSSLSILVKEHLRKESIPIIIYFAIVPIVTYFIIDTFMLVDFFSLVLLFIPIFFTFAYYDYLPASFFPTSMLVFRGMSDPIGYDFIWFHYFVFVSLAFSLRFMAMVVLPSQDQIWHNHLKGDENKGTMGTWWPLLFIVMLGTIFLGYMVAGYIGIAVIFLERLFVYSYNSRILGSDERKAKRITKSKVKGVKRFPKIPVTKERATWFPAPDQPHPVVESTHIEPAQSAPRQLESMLTREPTGDPRQQEVKSHSTETSQTDERFISSKYDTSTVPVSNGLVQRIDNQESKLSSSIGSFTKLKKHMHELVVLVVVIVGGLAIFFFMLPSAVRYIEEGQSALTIGGIIASILVVYLIFLFGTRVGPKIILVHLQALEVVRSQSQINAELYNVIEKYLGALELNSKYISSSYSFGRYGKVVLIFSIIIYAIFGLIGVFVIMFFVPYFLSMEMDGVGVIIVIIEIAVPVLIFVIAMFLGYQEIQPFCKHYDQEIANALSELKKQARYITASQ